MHGTTAPVDPPEDAPDLEHERAPLGLAKPDVLTAAVDEVLAVPVLAGAFKSDIVEVLAAAIAKTRPEDLVGTRRSITAAYKRVSGASLGRFAAETRPDDLPMLRRSWREQLDRTTSYSRSLFWHQALLASYEHEPQAEGETR